MKFIGSHATHHKIMCRNWQPHSLQIWRQCCSQGLPQSVKDESSVCAVVQLVEYRTRNREVAGSTHTRSTASNLEQVANLRCAQANSASNPQRDGKWVVTTATGWRPSVAHWGDGVSASCTVGACNCPLARAMDGHIMRCGTIGSCQSAATSEIVKRCWSRVYLM